MHREANILQKHNCCHFFNTSHLWKRSRKSIDLVSCMLPKKKSLILIFARALALLDPLSNIFLLSLLLNTREVFILSSTAKYLGPSCFHINEMPATFLDAFRMHWSYWKKNGKTNKRNKQLLCVIDFYLLTVKHQAASSYPHPVASAYPSRDYISLSFRLH